MSEKERYSPRNDIPHGFGDAVWATWRHSIPRMETQKTGWQENTIGR
jgi:hypothetical protein